ncbi:MAG: hypothetical protein COV72_05695 [Candidatus Omnitrophica bacterium CG11_big_fil_rev_8_21_14_0_20_42_13]|uniref:DUF192 domain-containing protein n=1 Tax=Candidatus Ghiorseimicrobium undicola TaxID=1974746 RepID=A0A2H0LX26_9BACT|nr:MAG: hypothetical protein COV72_05695 [Candidatus Omnitrophica bacterium CG11_big_fil_rev_8_21_14_0_20_42_13]
MKTYRIINIAKNTPVAERAEIAENAFSRMKGLLGRKLLNKSCALIIKPTSSIHTFFMKFPIDIAFLDKNNKILKIKHGVMPFRFISCPLGAKITIELPSGTLKASNTEIGDILAIQS